MTIADIVTKTRSLCDATSSDYTDANLLIDTNASIETLVSKIHQVCTDFDDDNFANIAEGTVDLQEGVSKYTISDRFLDVLTVKVKDIAGYWQIVYPWEQKENDEALETTEALKGLPLNYRILGRTIFLAPAPTTTVTTLTAGLKLTYTRTSYQITSGDVSTGTLVPGIATPWHVTICRMNAIEYCSTYKKDRVPKLMAQIQDEIYGPEGLLAFYSRYQKDKRTIITARKRAFK
jgi:hypothetical protein